MIASTNRLYKDLAWLWKLWGDPHKEYAEYSNYVMQNLQHLYPKRIESILVLGCGGGKNVFTVKKFGRTIGLDISPDMLNLAKQLNPEVDFVCADMRTFSLGSTFDAIFIDDAVSYMISEEDLSQLFTCCINHLKPGGVLSVSPDKTTENFQNNATETFRSIPHSQYPDTEIVYIVNDYDPDADDNTYETTFLYLIRQNGILKIETDLHLLGLFSIDTWRKLLSETGFVISESVYQENSDVYTTFFCKIKSD